MEERIEEWLERFLENTEYANSPRVDFKILFTDDIYNLVLQDDPEYAGRINADTTKGLYYVSKSGEQWLIIKNTDNLVEVFHNLIHELIHIYDFNELAYRVDGIAIRELQDNTFFILWSEFHAEYYSNKYFVGIGKDNIEPLKVVGELQDKLKNFMGLQSKMEIQVVADFCVRLYGQYLALYDSFQEVVSKYPSQFFINKDFLSLYDYLYEHKTFESIGSKIEELESIFKNLEQINIVQKSR